MTGVRWVAAVRGARMGVDAGCGERRRARRHPRGVRRRRELGFDRRDLRFPAWPSWPRSAATSKPRSRSTTALAREMRDPQVARRAVELAIRARAFGPALESAALLLELDPDSLARARDHRRAARQRRRPRQGREPRSRSMLDRRAGSRPAAHAAVALLRQVHRQGRGARGHAHDHRALSDMPEAHYAVGVAALRRADMTTLAAREVGRGARAAARLGAGRRSSRRRCFASTRPRPWSPFYRVVRRGPSRRPNEVRMQLGRELAADRKLAEAREQFREVEKLARQGRAGRLCRSGCSRCSSRTTTTREPRSRARSSQDYREPAAVYLGLGQAAEGLKQLRRGDRLVPEGRVRRLGARAAEDRDAHRAPAGPRRGARVPAPHRAAHRATTGSR